MMANTRASLAPRG